MTKLLLGIGLMTLSCNQEPDIIAQEKSLSDTPTETITRQEKSIPSDINTPIDSIEFDTEPPFRYPCEFEFHLMGEIRVSETRCEEIQCGKGWDSRRHSCSWVYGEHIYNQWAPDSLVKNYRMHIVDLDSSEIEMTPNFLKSKLFKDHTIATTIVDSEKDVFKTIWDPNRTGKYPKPNQWVE